MKLPPELERIRRAAREFEEALNAGPTEGLLVLVEQQTFINRSVFRGRVKEVTLPFIVRISYKQPSPEPITVYP